MPDSIPPVKMAHPVVLHERATEGTVWTVGHSTRSFPEFLDVLQAHAIETVVDVRRFPGSRRHPQFGAEPLGTSLATHGIDYHWLSGLGGRRRPDLLDVEGSVWRHPSFRAYAQHLRSEEFAQGLHALLHVAKASRTAIMCSELLWWRCHRRLIADVMVFCGWQVIHILGATDHSEHRLAAPASARPEGLSYVAPEDDEHAECC